MDVYRVLVVRESNGSCGGSEVLFEGASPDAGRLLGYALDEVETALTDIVDTLAEISKLKASGAIIDPAPQPVDAPAEQVDGDKPKRKRRTKAEIEADRARAAAGGSSFGEQVVADTESAVDAPASPLPADVPSSLAEPLPQQAPAAPAAPYNPFA